MLTFRVPSAAGFDAPTVSFDPNGTKVNIPNQGTLTRTGKVWMWVGGGVLVTGAVLALIGLATDS